MFGKFVQKSKFYSSTYLTTDATVFRIMISIQCIEYNTNFFAKVIFAFGYLGKCLMKNYL